MAVAGSGLSSLTVAWDLARKGYSIALFDAKDIPGTSLRQLDPVYLPSDAIVGEAGPVASRQRCGTIVVETYGKVMEILTANGIDPMTI